MKKKFDKTISDIGSLKIQGSSKVRKAAVAALKQSVAKSRAKTLPAFRRELQRHCLDVLKTRPTEPETRTAIRIILKAASLHSRNLQEVKERTLNSLENQDYQYEDLVENVSVNRDTSRNPLFDVMFSYREMFTKVEKEKIPGEERQDHPPEQKSSIYQPLDD